MITCDNCGEFITEGKQDVLNWAGSFTPGSGKFFCCGSCADQYRKGSTGIPVSVEG